MSHEGLALCCLCCTIPFVAVLSIARLAFSIAEIAVGAVFLRSCAREPMIPIWLIVSGVVSLVVVCFQSRPTFLLHRRLMSQRRKIMLQQAIEKEGITEKTDLKDLEEKDDVHPCVSCWLGLLLLFSLIWFIYGNVIVFLSRRNYNKTPFEGMSSPPPGGEDPMYCNPMAMDFALAAVVVQYVLLAFMIFFSCLAMCCLAGLLTWTVTKETEPEYSSM